MSPHVSRPPKDGRPTPKQRMLDAVASFIRLAQFAVNRARYCNTPRRPRFGALIMDDPDRVVGVVHLREHTGRYFRFGSVTP